MASADPEMPHVLQVELTQPAPVAPGAGGTVHIEVTNTGETATEALLVNFSLPPSMTLDHSDDCQETGRNAENGVLLSCNIDDDIAKLAPGQTNKADLPFRIAEDAPAGAELGTMTVVAVPIGSPEEKDGWKDQDKDDPHFAETQITTS